MEILSAFLTILEFIVIVLLIVLGIALFLLIFAIFGAIRYYVFIEKKENFYISVKISFIRIINFVFLFDENVGKSYFKILFFKVFKKGFAKKENSEKKITEKNKENFTDNDFKSDESKGFEKNSDEDFISRETSSKKYFSKKKGFDKEASFDKKYDKRKKVNNIFSFVKNIYNKFVYLKNYPEKGDIIKYTLRFIRELFLAIKPKKFNMNIIVGFDDPANTGMFLGLSAVILEFLPIDVYLSGDFENEIFEGTLETKGKTNIFKIGIPTLRYVFKKPVLRLIKKIF